MKSLVCAVIAFVSTAFRSHLSLQLEIVALRHQLTVYQRSTKRPRIQAGDRLLWSWLSRLWAGWHLDLRTTNCPEPRVIQLADIGPVKEVPEVGGLHHHYERLAA